MVMTGNVQPRFPMEHNMCWLQGMRNEKNYDNTRQHKPKNKQNNGGILATAPNRGTRSVKRNIGLSRRQKTVQNVRLFEKGLM